MSPRITAETVRNTSPSRPIAKPTVAMNRPAAVNDSAKPSASITAPARCADAAAARTRGSNGSTHGDRVDNMPARNPAPMLPTGIA